MSIPFVTPYNGKTKKVSVEFNGVSLTDQSCKDECDIGFIIENFVRTGQLPEKPNIQYLDCTTVQSFEDSMALVAECKSQFEQLPAVERDKFQTVTGWLNYVNNPDNLKDCVDKGYIDKNSLTEDVYNSLYGTNTVSNDKNVILDTKIDLEAPPATEKTVNANS